MTTALFERANHTKLTSFCRISACLLCKNRTHRDSDRTSIFVLFHLFPHLTDLRRNPDLSGCLRLKTCLVALTQSILHKHTYFPSAWEDEVHTALYMQGWTLMLTRSGNNAEEDQKHTHTHTHTHTCLTITFRMPIRKRQETADHLLWKIHIHSACVFLGLLNLLY